MDEVLIKNWNSVVSENDEIYHLGDVMFSARFDLLNRLNGKKYLILGNHDKKAKNRLKENFEILPPIYEFYHLNTYFVFCHYPIYDWNQKRKHSIHAYGHVHNDAHGFAEKNSFNISVENINYTPIKIEKLIEKQKKD